jgi:hypothetical protein
MPTRLTVDQRPMFHKSPCEAHLWLREYARVRLLQWDRGPCSHIMAARDEQICTNGTATWVTRQLLTSSCLLPALRGRLLQLRDARLCLGCHRCADPAAHAQADVCRVHF